MDSREDERRMLAVRDGDVRQLGTLFDDHGRMFYRYFVRMTNNPDTSWDLVQEMFLRILKYRHSFRDTGTFTGWAFRIARNVMHDHYRGHEREVPLALAGERSTTADVLPLAQVESAQEVTILKECLNLLPPEKRELLVLSHYEKMPYNDIAKILSISVGNVKVRVHRAIKDLRQIYVQHTNKRPSDE